MSYYKYEVSATSTIYQGDCLEVMPVLEKEGIKVDMVLTDLPYGTTHCKWDVPIDLPLMWKQVYGITHASSPLLFFGQQPFTSVLGTSNLKDLRYSWIWQKTTVTGHLNAKRMPMKGHEEVLVFYRKQPFYSPIKTTGHNRKIIKASHKEKCDQGDIYNPHLTFSDYDSTERYPRSVITFKTDKQFAYYHSTQKPVALLEYFIRTYTKEDDTVLDFTMGSGSTGVACNRCKRKFIGIELDGGTFQTAKERIMYEG